MENHNIKFMDYKKQDRIKYVNEHQVEREVLNYLIKIFQNLEIKKMPVKETNLLMLMKMKVLMGWCFETTETAILLLDDAKIERGRLYTSRFAYYEHSWIVFNYNNKEYIFDPCLEFLCESDIYREVFETKIKATVTAEEVKDYFIKCVNHNSEEVIIKEQPNITDPMYKNGVGYKAQIENGKIKKLKAHYYYKREY